MFLCTFLAFAFAIVFTLSRTRWAEINSADPAKVLATEVFQSVNAYFPWAEANGSRWQAMTHRAWVRLASKGGSSQNGESLEK
jgi:hypothetical protein